MIRRQIAVTLTVALLALARVSATAAPLSEPDLATLRQVDRVHASTSPTQDAVRLVTRIGREKDIDRLKAVLDMQRRDLTRILCDTFEVMDPSLPAPLEALFVERYDDPEYHQLLRCVVGSRVEPDGARLPKYRTRALFDKLYDTLLNGFNGRRDLGIYLKIVATDLPGIEPALVDALTKVDGVTLAELVHLLARRKYVPAVPELIALQKSPPSRDRRMVLSALNAGLAQIGTPESVQAVVDWLAAMRSKATDRIVEAEMIDALGALTYLSPGGPPDYDMLRAALPRDMSANLRTAFAEVIVKRKEARGVPELILSLQTPNQTNEKAVAAIIEMGTQDDMRAAQKHIYAWRLREQPPPSYYTDGMVKRLDAALDASPAGAAARSTAARTNDFELARSALSARRAAALAVQVTEPSRYATELESALQGASRLAAQYADLPQAASLGDDTAQEFVRLADFLRFALREPRRAIVLYEQGIRILEQGPRSRGPAQFERVWVADTVRFDLRDTRRSLEAYEQLSGLMEKTPPDAGQEHGAQALRRAMQEYLAAEIGFLRDGRRFSGGPGKEAVSIASPALLLSSESPTIQDPVLAKSVLPLRMRTPTDVELRDLASALDALPPSQRYLVSTFSLLPVLGSPERIVAFLRKHDPSGYLTAVGFAALPGIDKYLASRPNRQGPGLRYANWSESDRALMKRAEALASRP